jgi:hypothetical protein
MRDYRGLSEQQFRDVRATAETMSTQLPDGFTLRFNDTLIQPPRTRTMSLYQMSETWKGWHVVIRPDGAVRTSVRAWGRTWRTDETFGNINTEPLGESIESRPATAPFARAEELARKFHLHTNAPLILRDLHDVANAEAGNPVPCVADAGSDTVASVPAAAADLGADIAGLAARIRAHPGRYRVREEDGFALLFDTRSHDVCLLTDAEFTILGADLVKVASCGSSSPVARGLWGCIWSSSCCAGLAAPRSRSWTPVGTPRHRRPCRPRIGFGSCPATCSTSSW